jgi:hypothetical protein
MNNVGKWREFLITGAANLIGDYRYGTYIKFAAVFRIRIRSFFKVFKLFLITNILYRASLHYLSCSTFVTFFLAVIF